MWFWWITILSFCAFGRLRHFQSFEWPSKGKRGSTWFYFLVSLFLWYVVKGLTSNIYCTSAIRIGEFICGWMCEFFREIVNPKYFCPRSIKICYFIWKNSKIASISVFCFTLASDCDFTMPPAKFFSPVHPWNSQTYNWLSWKGLHVYERIFLTLVLQDSGATKRL